MPEQKEENEQFPQCPLCLRLVPDPEKLSDHHLVPRSRGGRSSQIPICVDCHRQIHAMYSNKQLEAELNTVEALLAEPMFSGFVAWIANRPLGAMAKPKRAKGSRRRGRSG